jgi:molybdate transport system regulatory protein
MSNTSSVANPVRPAVLGGGRKVDRVALLEKVAALGSISAAAKAAGVSYKGAWEAIEALNNLSDAPVVERLVGGSGGGGTRLTAHGKKVLDLLRNIDVDFQSFLAAMGNSGKSGQRFDRFYQYFQVMRRWHVKTSARNQFLGTIKAVKHGPINAEVVLDIGGGDELAAIITNESAENLGLAPGIEAYAMFKASWVIVVTDDGMKTSARNHLRGTVARVVSGPVSGEIVIDLPGGKSVAATVTRDSIDSLGLKEGAPASALIKAAHVILAMAN